MKPARKRQMVDHTRATWQVSIRRACRALPVDRSTYHYRPRRPEQAGLRNRIKEIAETRVRYGYRRIHVLLRREGWPVNAKRVCRLYREMGLQLRNKTPKRRVKATCCPGVRSWPRKTTTWWSKKAFATSANRSSESARERSTPEISAPSRSPSRVMRTMTQW